MGTSLGLGPMPGLTWGRLETCGGPSKAWTTVAQLGSHSTPTFPPCLSPSPPCCPKKQDLDMWIQWEESSQKQFGEVRLSFPRSSGKS